MQVENALGVLLSPTFTLLGGNMLFSSQKLKSVILFLMVGVFFTPALQVRAEDHVVSPSDLHQTLVSSAKARQTDLEKVQRFFSSELVRKTLASTKTNLKQVEDALPHLTDEELARLAAQTQKVQADLVAGALSNQEITYILIALATAVIILVIVVA
jgi:hypothetical protein